MAPTSLGLQGLPLLLSSGEQLPSTAASRPLGQPQAGSGERQREAKGGSVLLCCLARPAWARPGLAG